MTDPQQTKENGNNSPLSQSLGDEEEAWYRHDRDSDSIRAVKQWLHERRCSKSASGNPLGNDEDAWARR